MHKMRDFVNDKGNIRPSHLEMLEATNHLTIYGGIDQGSTIFSNQRSTYDSGVETGLESSMLCLRRRSITYFC